MRGPRRGRLCRGAHGPVLRRYATLARGTLRRHPAHIGLDLPMTPPTMTPPRSLAERRRQRIDLALRVAFLVVLVMFTIFRPIQAGDAIAYWKVDLADPYTRPVATQDAFTYPPPAALVFAVLGKLPFELFQALWTMLIGLALLWLTGPWALLFLVIPVVASDLYLGNIHILLAAAI